MTTRRKDIVCVEDTPFYHCISGLAHGLPLLARDSDWVKIWIENRLCFLAEVFAIGVCGHALMDTHFHLLLLVQVEVAEQWSGKEVASRWARLCPPRDRKRKLLTGEELQFWVDEKSKDERWIGIHRQRLMDLGWFHRFLKQPLSRLINAADGTSGTIFKGRYKSIAVLDAEGLMATNIYVDLNPLAAGISATPEESKFTSLRLRFDNALRNWKLDELITSLRNCVSFESKTSEIEKLLWLVAIENKPRATGDKLGMFESVTLGQYFLLVDQAARIPRVGKASLSIESLGILDRMAIAHERWVRINQALATGVFRGNYLSSSRETLRRIAKRLGKRHLVNLNGIRTQ